MQHDMLWHAGDWGDIKVFEELEKLAPLYGVYGNIDGQNIRMENPKYQIFMVENCKVLMTHIGGYPKKYNPEFRKKIIEEKPNIVVTGHSHILKVMFDKELNHLHINPGAAGQYGFHQVRTMVSIEINGSKIENARVIELPK